METGLPRRLISPFARAASDLRVDRIFRLARHAVPAPGAAHSRGVDRGVGRRGSDRAARAGSWPAAWRRPATKVRRMRSCRPFRCGLPGAIRSGATPALIARTERRDRPPTPRGGERRAVVGAKPDRPVEFAEGRVENRADVLDVAPGQRRTAQQKAAHRSAVRNGRRRRSQTSPGSRCAVGHVARAEGRARGLRRRRSRFTVSPWRSNRRPIALAAGRAIKGARRSRKGARLQRPPGRMRPTRRTAALGDLVRNRLRMMVRRPRAVEQILDAHLADRAHATRSPFSGSPRTAGEEPQTVPLASRPQS